MSMLKAGRPSRDNAKNSFKIEDLNEDTVRLSLDISKTLHKKIRMRALDQDVKIKELVKQVLEKEFA